jgi:RNA polymerase sigma-70 factor (ECF subfamily)
MDVVQNAPAPSPQTAARWLEDHGDALYAYARARVGRDPHIAEDLVQEALLAAMASANRLEGQAAERSWLIGILRHKLLDHLRTSLRERPFSVVNARGGDDADDADGLADLFDRRGRWKTPPSKWTAATTAAAADPHALAESAEFKDVLGHCLSRLPSRMAHLSWLRAAEGIETRELCRQLDVSEVNAWTLLHRARSRLRRCLSLHWFEGGKAR